MQSSNGYRVTEPHPSVPSSHFIHAGRGGLGNHTLVDPKTITNGANASGPASRINLPQHSTYHTGRGGLGNAQHKSSSTSSSSSTRSPQSERAMFSFDEELAFQERLLEHQAPMYHVGRGGMGNAVAGKVAAAQAAARTSAVVAARPSVDRRSSSSGELEGGKVRRGGESSWARFFSRH